MSVPWLKAQLDQVRGHVVSMPLEFLDKGWAGPLLSLAVHQKAHWNVLLPKHHKERLLALDASVNPITLCTSFSLSFFFAPLTLSTVLQRSTCEEKRRGRW
jgi:hypothetical protein